MDPPGRQLVNEVLHGLDDPYDEAALGALVTAEVVLHHSHPQVDSDEQKPLMHGQTHQLKYTSAKSKAASDQIQEEMPEVKELTTKQVVLDELYALAKLALPLFVASLLEFMPTTALTMMIGHTSADKSAQVLAAFNMSFIFQMVCLSGILDGVASAMDTFCCQAFGARRLPEMWMFCQAGVVIFLICMPFVALVLAMASPILQMLGQDPELATIAGNILSVLILVLPPTMMYSVIKTGLQAQNIAAPIVTASFVSLVVTLSLAYLLAFPLGLGYIGVTLGIPIAFMVKVAVLLPSLARSKAFREAWPGWRLRDAALLVPKVAKLGCSSALMIVFQTLGITSISLLAGMLPQPDVTISANGIFASALTLAAVPLGGVCVAGAIRVANALGAGDPLRARIVANLTLYLSLMVSASGMVVFLLIADTFAHAFTTDARAIEMLSEIMAHLWIIIPLLGVSFGQQSIYRACGRQFLCAQLNFGCLFMLGVPLSILFGMKLGGGIEGLWIGSAIGSCMFICIGARWTWRIDWQIMASDAQRNARMHHAKVKEHQDLVELENCTPCPVAGAA